MQRYTKDEPEISDQQLSGRSRPGSLSAPTEPVFTPCPELESKAERIARYKAERRRQLAERYGISLDQDTNSGYSSRYSRARREQDGPDIRTRGESEVDQGTYTTSASPRPGRTVSQLSHALPEVALSRLDSFSEQERLMNLENQRRTAPPEPASTYMDMTSLSSPRVPSKDPSVTAMHPSSPRLSRHHSLSSPQHGVSPGDLLIEQQAHSILSRQG